MATLCRSKSASRQLRPLLVEFSRKVLSNSLDADEQLELKADVVVFGGSDLLLRILRYDNRSEDDNRVSPDAGSSHRARRFWAPRFGN